MRIHAQSLQDLCHTKKETIFLKKLLDLKNIDVRQHVFVCEDLTPLRYKLLRYMQKSCYDTFTSCYTRNGNIKLSSKHLKNGSPSLHLMISLNTELMLIINRWAVAKYLTTNPAAKILPSVNSETKRPMQATIRTWTTNWQKQNAYVSRASLKPMQPMQLPLEPRAMVFGQRINFRQMHLALEDSVEMPYEFHC